MKRRLLWVGDACVPSGFARATHEILDVLRHTYEITVLGINYFGDPYPYCKYAEDPYDVYSAFAGGDSFGVGRIVWMCDKHKPDVVVFQNDGWNIELYVKALRAKNEKGESLYPMHDHIKLVAITAVDGKNFRKEWLDGIDYAIFWTHFALNEARLSGYSGPASVIPLGVDIDHFKPAKSKEEARLLRGFPSDLDKAFIVGNVNRNQPRKRWDLTLRYFSMWVKRHNIQNAYLFMHCAPTADMGIDVKQMAKYLGIEGQVILVEPPPFYGLSEQVMRDTYNAFDVQITTTGGEGFGLTTFEGMACGIPQIVPKWSALEDLVSDCAVMVPCTSTALNPVAPALNIIHGVPDEEKFIHVLHQLYLHPDWRKQYGEAGRKFVEDDKFRWPNIGRRYLDVLEEVVNPKSEKIAVSAN